MAERAFGFQVNASLDADVARPALSAPPVPRYHERACVPGIGKRENDCSNPG